MEKLYKYIKNVYSQNGEITGDIRFLQSFYDNIVKKEKEKL